MENGKKVFYRQKQSKKKIQESLRMAHSNLLIDDVPRQSLLYLVVNESNKLQSRERYLGQII